MFYEDVKVLKGETVSGVAKAYGYKISDWKKIWSEPRNVGLATRRHVPEKLQIGDVIQVKIPWRITTKILTKQPRGAYLVAEHDGAGI